jgi:hypothetical protein
MQTTGKEEKKKMIPGSGRTDIGQDITLPDSRKGLFLLIPPQFSETRCAPNRTPISSKCQPAYSAGRNFWIRHPTENPSIRC